MEKLLLEKEYKNEETKMLWATELYEFSQLTIVKQLLPNKISKLIEKQRKNCIEDYMVLGVFIDEQKGLIRTDDLE